MNALNKDKLLELAKEAGLTISIHTPRPNLERFASLVLSAAQEEREPVAWIEHHKAGDNLSWEPVDHPYANASPLYLAPPSSDQVWSEAVEAAGKQADGFIGCDGLARRIRSLKRPLQAQEQEILPQAPLDPLYSPKGGGDGLVPEPSASPAAQSGAADERFNTGRALGKYVDEQLEDYEFRGDSGDYSPSDQEQLLMSDFVHGLLSDDEFIRLVSTLSRAQAAPAVSEEEVQRLWDENVSFDPPPRGNYSRELLAFANACAALSAPAPAPVSEQPAAQTAGVPEVTRMLELLKAIVDCNVHQGRCANADMLAHDIRMLAAAPQPVAGQVGAYLCEDDVEWVVNDNAELGVKIGGQFFFLYKGESLIYKDGKHDDGTPMLWRLVGKREFGECCHPIKFWKPGAVMPKRYTEELVYTPGLSFGSPEDFKWRTLPAHPQAAQAKGGSDV